MFELMMKLHTQKYKFKARKNIFFANPVEHKELLTVLHPTLGYHLIKVPAQ